MAIAFGAVGTAASQTATGPLNLTGPTVTGSDTIGFAMGFGGSGVDTLTGITWGGVAMTFIGKILTNNNHYSYLYYVLNPSSGATVAISYTGSGFMAGSTAYYTGAQQSSQPDSSNTASYTGSSSFSPSTTTVAADAWVVGLIACDDGSAFTAGANTIMRSNYGISFNWADSNGARAAGANALNFTMPINNGNGIVASITPLTAPATSIKTVNGLAKASVKTKQGLAIASVKTINGLA
jgi:hypothetical protein